MFHYGLIGLRLIVSTVITWLLVNFICFATNEIWFSSPVSNKSEGCNANLNQHQNSYDETFFI